jgi:hypothetical protein
MLQVPKSIFITSEWKKQPAIIPKHIDHKEVCNFDARPSDILLEMILLPAEIVHRSGRFLQKSPNCGVSLKMKSRMQTEADSIQTSERSDSGPHSPLNMKRRP